MSVSTKNPSKWKVHGAIRFLWAGFNSRHSSWIGCCILAQILGVEVLCINGSDYSKEEHISMTHWEVWVLLLWMLILSKIDI